VLTVRSSPPIVTMIFMDTFQPTVRGAIGCWSNSERIPSFARTLPGGPPRAGGRASRHKACGPSLRRGSDVRTFARLLAVHILSVCLRVRAFFRDLVPQSGLKGFPLRRGLDLLGWR
jgi:hypothetical protein